MRTQDLAGKASHPLRSVPEGTQVFLGKDSGPPPLITQDKKYQIHMAKEKCVKVRVFQASQSHKKIIKASLKARGSSMTLNGHQ
jgi:hypothetical protein